MRASPQRRRASRGLDNVKFSAIIDELSQAARDKNGYILNDQINDLIGDEFDIELSERIYEKLADLHIDYFDNEEDARRKIRLRASPVMDS